jgi:hypothetical protein
LEPRTPSHLEDGRPPGNPGLSNRGATGGSRKLNRLFHLPALGQRTTSGRRSAQAVRVVGASGPIPVTPHPVRPLRPPEDASRVSGRTGRQPPRSRHHVSRATRHEPPGPSRTCRTIRRRARNGIGTCGPSKRKFERPRFDCPRRAKTKTPKDADQTARRNPRTRRRAERGAELDDPRPHGPSPIPGAPTQRMRARMLEALRRASSTPAWPRREPPISGAFRTLVRDPGACNSRRPTHGRFPPTAPDLVR